jgi:hypothetical protein
VSSKADAFIFEDSIESFDRFASRVAIVERYRHIPGDIVECGVYRGTGMMTWLRLTQQYKIEKRVVGFDWFDIPAMLGALPKADRESMKTIFKKPKTMPSKAAIETTFKQLNYKNFTIYDGDVAKTAPLHASTGRPISVLYMDLDCEGPTYAALTALYPLVSPGGVVLFDDYGTKKWSEKAGADRYCDENGLARPKAWHLVRPRAYMVKGATNESGN